ncbi:MAG: hypothetical protein ACYC7E_10915 [Armatimonadota bacterium]
MAIGISTSLALANDVRIALLTHGDEFLGFGEIYIGDVCIRSGQVPMRAHLSTPTGYQYTRFFLESIEGDAPEQRVRLRAEGRNTLRGDRTDDWEGDLIFPSVQHVAPVSDTVTWIFTPCSREIDGEIFQGFTYALEFSSSARKIFYVTIESTFELGGDINGVTHLSQGQCNMPSYTGATDTFFTTSVLKTLGKPAEGEAGVWNQSMQMCGRHGTIQCFDYQYSPLGVLAGIWEKGEYVRSLIQKNTGETVLFIVDEHHVPYDTQARTCAKQILFTPVTDPLRARDLWKMTKDEVVHGFERQWGVHIVPLHTEAHINESWIGNQPGSDCWYGNKVVSHDKILYLLADEWLPKIQAQGIELAGFSSFSECDVTEMGSRTKLQDGIHGGFLVSSICNVWRYYPAQYWGGMDAWKYFAGAAHALGLQVGTWIGGHISGNAPVMREHPEWFNTGRSGRSNLGGYSCALGAAINWNTGARQWIIDSLKRWRDEGGLDYIFFDSWGNIAQLPIHYGAIFTNNLDGSARLIAELQQAGFAYIENEGMGPFCAPRFGLGTHQTMAEGQNSIFWWFGNEDMADGTTPGIRLFENMTEEQMHAQHFRFFANYALFTLAAWDEAPPAALLEKIGRNDVWAGTSGVHLPDYYHRILAIWPEVRDAMCMRRRRTLPDGQGIFWTGGPFDALWSYKGFTCTPPAGKQVEQVYPNRRSLGAGTFETEPLAVYLMR